MAFFARSLIMLLVLGTVSIASAGVVTFDGYTPLDTTFAVISTGGLDFTANPGGDMYVWDSSVPGGNGTPALIDGNGEGSTSIMLTGGGAFTLDSFDMALSWYTTVDPDTVDVTAHFQGGGSSTQTLTLIGSMQTFNLNLANVTEVDVSLVAANDGYWAMDNVTYNASTVPEPASLALVGSGLVLAGLRFRRNFRRK